MLTIGEQSNDGLVGFYDSGDDTAGKNINDFATQKKVVEYISNIKVNGDKSDLPKLSNSSI